MQEIDYILEFVTRLGKEMLTCGANIERVNLTIELLCQEYRLTEVSVQSLSNSITVSAKAQDGTHSIRQISVPPARIHLEKLRRLNHLSYRVRREKPAADSLNALLQETQQTTGYPLPVRLLGYLVAMACLCRIFGGAWQDVVVVAINTVLLFFLTSALSKIYLNHIITNVVNMFLCGSIAFAFVYMGFAQNFYTIIITNAFFLIPGIPMVNAMRNLLCGNEMNGILELLKVVLEVVSIVAGLWLAFLCFGGWYEGSFGDSITDIKDAPWEIELVILSFFASLGFGIVFEIRPVDLVFAGIGGAIVRIVYLALMSFLNYRIAFIALAAFSAALYAELLAFLKKTPTTVFLYPSIIPLIPGDLFYYAMVGLITLNNDFFAANATDCILSLVGISVGFVLCSSFIHYVRRIRFSRNKKIAAASQKQA